VKRQLAEFENFRNRTEKEKHAMFETGAKSVVEKILPVVDNFERGLATVPEDKKEDPFVDGMVRIYKQLLTELENIGVSNKAGLHHLLTLFASCPSLPEAHRLSAMAFGAQQARHYSVNADQEPDRIDRSTYDEPPLTYTVQPRLRTYKPRMERKGFADKSEEKARQREKLLAEEQALKQQKMALLHTANFSAYARKMLIDGYIVNVDTSDIRAQTAEIQKIGVNVNQIARRVNSTGTVYAQDMEDIKGALAEIWQLQRYILSSQR